MRPMLRIALGLALVGVTVSSCGDGGSTGATGACVDVPGIVEAMAWSPGGEVLATSARDGSGGHVSVVSWPERNVVRVASGPDVNPELVSVGDLGEPYWVEGWDDPRLRTLVENHAKTIAHLGDPLTVGIYWTIDGFRMLRWSGAGLPDRPPGESWSLVEATVEGDRVRFGEPLIQSSDLRQVWVAPDGGENVLLFERVGEPSRLELFADGRSQIVGEYTGIAHPSLLGRREVVVRRSADSLMVAIDVADGSVRALSATPALVGAVSSTGVLATASTRPAGSSQVCMEFAGSTP